MRRLEPLEATVEQYIKGEVVKMATALHCPKDRFTVVSCTFDKSTDTFTWCVTTKVTLTARKARELQRKPLKEETACSGTAGGSGG